MKFGKRLAVVAAITVVLLTALGATAALADPPAPGQGDVDAMIDACNDMMAGYGGMIGGAGGMMGGYGGGMMGSYGAGATGGYGGGMMGRFQ